MAWLQFVAHASFLCFVVGCVARFVKYSRMPAHLRSEVYPVSHVLGHKTGGSHMEDYNEEEKKPLRRNVFGELRYMAREGLLFEKCYRHNRGLWYFTYPFHLGLLLLVIWLVLLQLGAWTMISGVSFDKSPSILIISIKYLTLGVGIPGMILTIFGCIGLITKRSIDDNLKPYTTVRDYFNLSLILAIVLSGLISWLSSDSGFDESRELARSLITFTPGLSLTPPMIVGLTLFSFFLVYLPFTAMMHGLAKYFIYHRVAWDDELKMNGSNLDRKVREQLAQSVDWSAPHIRHGTWNEILSNRKD